MKSIHSNLEIKPTPKLLRCWLWASIGFHVICGICTLSFLFPFLDRKQKNEKIQKWSQRLLNIFNIQLKVERSELMPSTPYLLVSNHISWLDIHVINAFTPVRFVAKSEVESWPIFGWMAKQLGTVFIRRDSSRHARQVVGQMADVLNSESICIFPEGTSTAGETVLPFRSNLFQAVVGSQTPVLPMAIQYYLRSTGERTNVAAFIGDMGLLESMSNILKNRHIQAKIIVLPPIMQALHATGDDRKRLALRCQELIAKAI